MVSHSALCDDSSMKVCPSAFNGEITKAQGTKVTFALQVDRRPGSVRQRNLFNHAFTPVAILIGAAPADSNRLWHRVVKRPRQLTHHEMVRYKVTQCIQIS